MNGTADDTRGTALVRLLTELGCDLSMAMSLERDGLAIVSGDDPAAFSIELTPAGEARAANESSGRATDDLIDALDVEVTGAIIRAERMADSGDARGAAAEFAKVARAEARLADLHPADELEGFIAREGAVSAYMKAGERDLAESLAAFYQRDPKLRPDSREAILRHLGGGEARQGAPDGAGEEDGD